MKIETTIMKPGLASQHRSNHQFLLQFTMNIQSSSLHRRCHSIKQWRSLNLEGTLQNIWTIFNSERDDLTVNCTVRCLHYFITFIIMSGIYIFVTIESEWAKKNVWSRSEDWQINQRGLCCVAQVKSEGWLTGAIAELITYWSCLAAWVIVTFEVSEFFLLYDYVEEVHLDNVCWQGESCSRLSSMASCGHVWESFFESSMMFPKLESRCLHMKTPEKT